MATFRAVNWHDEGLESYYGDSNNGLIYGIYLFDGDEDFPLDVEWYGCEQIRDSIIERLKTLDNQ
jgi:hypothetical protein